MVCMSIRECVGRERRVAVPSVTKVNDLSNNLEKVVSGVREQAKPLFKI